MIPLRDTLPSRRLPLMTWLLILVNLGVFIYQKSLTNHEAVRLVVNIGLIPDRFYQFALDQNLWRIIPVFTYMTLHGSWVHLISNLWALWLFGDNVEDRMGKFRFLLFYILMGAIAGFTHIIFNSTSIIPVIGASGAISGVMGAYFVMYPSSKITTLVPLFFIPLFIDIPAIIYLAFWFFSQIYSAIVPSLEDVSNIAWWAHIGGFVAGIIFHRLFVVPDRRWYY